MKDALEKQRQELEDKRRRIESGRPLTPCVLACSLHADLAREKKGTKKSGFLRA